MFLARAKRLLERCNEAPVHFGDWFAAVIHFQQNRIGIARFLSRWPTSYPSSSQGSCIRRGAGALEKVTLDSKPFSASTDELSGEQQEQQQSVHSYTDHLIRHAASRRQKFLRKSMMMSVTPRRAARNSWANR